MDVTIPSTLAQLRAAVGYLGERDQHGWWQSSFLSSGSKPFLAPVFGRTLREKAYTVRLAAGLGLIDETVILLDLWQEGMDTSALTRIARESGRFPGLSASRLDNLVSDGFALRYLVADGPPARLLKALHPHLTRREFEQLLFLYTCRAHAILADFVRDVYWPAYAAGRTTLDN